MLNLQKRLKGIDENRAYLTTRIAVRDKLLSQERKEIEEHLKTVKTCKLTFPSTSQLHIMNLTVRPNQGFYDGGVFNFTIEVPPEYNNVPPIVKCTTKVWHPNINEDGAVCLSLLRQSSLDGMGWMPTRGVKDVILGLESLFGDLMDFDDPLNLAAAESYNSDKNAFSRKVRDYISRYCH